MDYKCVKYELNEPGNPVYKGEHLHAFPLESDLFWRITKYTYSSSNKCTGEKTIEGAWTDRETLFEKYGV